MMIQTGPSILKDAEVFISDLYTTKVNETVKFHTLNHTRDVVAACQRMADYYHIPEEDRQALLLAAWFHDSGFSSGQAKDHETVSAKLATTFLTEHNASPELMGKVIGCINATRMPQNPANTLEKIMCDADLFHLGTEDFDQKNRLLREELRTFGREDISKKDWWKNNIAFLEAHKYFTTYGQDNLQPIKLMHLKSLKENVNAGKKKKKNRNEDAFVVPDLQVAAKKDKKESDNKSERGISTVFRIMAQNQNNLSQMADSKANILISVNSIILSIIISTLFTKLDSNPNLQLPVILLVIVCVIAIVFSILATRPNVNHGTFTQEDIHNKKTNLLFFGNFYKMGLHDYDWAMQEMLNDKDYLYNSIVKDNYFLGVVLAKKYSFLRLAYNVFMYGLILSMIAFAIAFAIPQAGEVYLPG